MTKLVKIRTACGMSQVELSKRSGVSRGAIRKIEDGRSSPTLTTVYKLAAALEVHPTMLLDYEKVAGAEQAR